MNTTSPSKLNRCSAAVFGARGYAGLELTRILLKHPSVRLGGAFATSPFALSQHLPEPAARFIQARVTNDALELARAGEFEIAFLATPTEASIDLAPKLLELGVKVIDLSGAFRLKGSGLDASKIAYRKWYGFDHAALAQVQEAEYGMAAFLPAQTSARLIANPGCYATASLMAILPLLKEGVIDSHSISIDGKSGTTGAGRKAEERLMHAEVAGGCLPYRAGGHQHEPEISEAALSIGGKDIDFHFTPHLLDARRGLIASCYMRAANVPGSTKKLSDGALLDAAEAAFASAYASNSLVECERLLSPGGSSPLLSLRRVLGSARTQIAYAAQGEKLYVFCLIDNLMKGAASQAVENMNRMLGLPPSTGLAELEGTL